MQNKTHFYTISFINIYRLNLTFTCEKKLCKKHNYTFNQFGALIWQRTLEKRQYLKAVI